MTLAYGPQVGDLYGWLKGPRGSRFAYITLTRVPEGGVAVEFYSHADGWKDEFVNDWPWNKLVEAGMVGPIWWK